MHADATKVIHVSVDCVTRGATTYDATFAYANDNAAAQTVPVGTDNYFAPPPIDRGPDHDLPARRRTTAPSR